MIHLTPEKSGSVCELYLFDERGLDTSIKKLHWKKSQVDFTDLHNEEIRCGICDEKLTKENFAAFMPGSVKAVCSKTSCFLAALATAKQK